MTFNQKLILSIVVPLIFVFLPSLIWSRIGTDLSVPIKSTLIGLIVAFICFLILKFVAHHYRAVHYAVLAGLLSAEIMIFSQGNVPQLPAILLITFVYANAYYYY